MKHYLSISTILILLSLLQFGASSAARGQILDVQVVGSIYNTGGFDSSVSVGGTLTLNYEINEADAQVTYTASGEKIYSFSTLGASSATETLGNYVFTQVDASSADITSDSATTGTYGYFLSSVSTLGGTTAGVVDLESTSTPAVAPSTSLESIQTFPLADFNDGTTVQAQGDGGYANATVTSYSVTTVPEPGTFSSVTIGLIALALVIRLDPTKSKV